MSQHVAIVVAPNVSPNDWPSVSRNYFAPPRCGRWIDDVHDEARQHHKAAARQKRNAVEIFVQLNARKDCPHDATCMRLDLHADEALDLRAPMVLPPENAGTGTAAKGDHVVVGEVIYHRGDARESAGTFKASFFDIPQNIPDMPRLGEFASREPADVSAAMAGARCPIGFEFFIRECRANCFPNRLPDQGDCPTGSQWSHEWLNCLHAFHLACKTTGESSGENTEYAVLTGLEL